MYASTPTYKGIKLVASQLQRKGRTVSKPYKTTYRGQKVWQVRYTGKPAKRINKYHRIRGY